MENEIKHEYVKHFDNIKSSKPAKIAKQTNPFISVSNEMFKFQITNRKINRMASSAKEF